MKLGKESLLAMIETALFVIGAAFFIVVIMTPSNPIWALIAGIVCGVAGMTIWLGSLFIRLSHKIKSQKITADNVAKQILAEDDMQSGYELHRSDFYEDTMTENEISEILPDLPATESDQPSAK